MKTSFPGYVWTALVFWVLVVATIAVWVLHAPEVTGWDLRVYGAAVDSLRAGRDPYADGIMIQRAFHSSMAEHPGAPAPLTYVYSPLTLPMLRWIGLLPTQLAATLYWTVYALGAAAIVWVGLQFTEGAERKVFVLFAPASLFFPGLLEKEILFSGNVGYIVYGLALLAILHGFVRGRWGWLYLVLFVASPCKAPLLSLLVVPVFSARRQWLPAGVTGAASVALLLGQSRVWPELFHNYLVAAELQFSLNHDFGGGPAGLLADALKASVPYRTTSACVYLLFAPAILLTMFYVSRRYLAGQFSWKAWAPVALTGAVLLNPRIMEYDLAAITLPMALIVWRFFSRTGTMRRTAIWMAAFFAAINLAAVPWGSSNPLRAMECVVLIVVFVGGAWTLWSADGAQDDRRDGVPG